MHRYIDPISFKQSIVVNDCRERPLTLEEIIDAEQSVNVPRWISLVDEVPRSNGCYLFCGTEALNNEKYLCKVKYWCNGEIRPFNYAPSVEFTHWMPLPEPPKEGE